MIRQSLVKAKVREALADAGQTKPPVNLDRICERNGLQLRRGEALGGGQQAHYDEARGEIAVTERRSGRVERFSIAHELGHALMAHGSHECYEGTPTVAPVSLDEADTSVDFEAEADAFADELLIPTAWLRHAVIDEELTISELRQRFEATNEVMFIALKNRRLLNKVRM